MTILPSGFIEKVSQYLKLGNRANQKGQWKNLLLRISIVLLVYIVLDKMLLWISSLPLNSYYSYNIVLQLLHRIFTNFWVAAGVVLGLLLGREKLFVSWSTIEKGYTIRWLMLSLAAMLVWKYSLSDYNYYFDSWYFSDRIMLLFTAILILWRPLFILPFVLFLYAFIGQFEFLPVYSLAADFLLIRIMLMFLCLFIIRIFTGNFKFIDFVFLTGCLLGAHYFLSGILKISSEWLMYDQIYYLLPDLYATGWASFIEPEMISSIAYYLSWFNVPLKLFTIVVECGMLFIFYNIRWARLLMFSAIIFHLGVLLVSGIYFWMWIVILVLFLFYLRKERALLSELFIRPYLLISVVLIGLGEIWCDPVGLAWHDSPMNYSYKFEAEMEDNSIRNLPPGFFSPYDYQFTLGNFSYLSPNKLLPIVWGATTKDVSKALRKEVSAKNALKVEAQIGRVHSDSIKRDFFYRFIRQYVFHWNTRKMEEPAILKLQPPRLVLTYPSNMEPIDSQKILAVRIKEVTTYYSHDLGYRVLRDREIGRVKIPEDQTDLEVTPVNMK